MPSMSRPLTRKSSSFVRHTARPWLEHLERRDCPAPVISNFAGRILSSSSVELTGNVSDDHPNNVIVEISGGSSAGLMVTLDANNNGQFSLALTDVVSLSTFFAQATDDLETNSPSVSTVPNNGPTLTLACNQQANRNVRVYGSVNDANAANLTVTFSGIISGTTTTDTSGNYVYTALASALGGISATVTDGNNATSNTAQTTLTNVAPSITNYSASNSGNTWTFTGRVNDEWAMGLTVTLTTPGVQNSFTTTVGSDCYFSASVNIPGNPFGTATAVTTDWWGLSSNLAQILVRSGNT